MFFSVLVVCLLLAVIAAATAAAAYQQDPLVQNKPRIRKQLSTTTLSSSSPHPRPRRPLVPPFPDGCCGGTLVTIPPEDTYGKAADLPLVSDVVLPPREIKVWLPPGYDDDNDDDDNNNERSVVRGASSSSSDDDERRRRFPVLYCHDGQNALEDSSSWTGASWRLAGALTRLKERGLIRDIPIVVLLPSAEGDLLPGLRRRHLEYGDTGQPFAEAHADFVATTVKPCVDETFRTRPGRDSTFCIGTSMGGQASLHILVRHPELFGGAACLSPAFQPATLAAVVANTPVLRDKRIYIDIGGDTDDKKVPFLDVMDHLTQEHWWNPGYFWLDTQLQPSVDAMRLALDLTRVDHAYHKAPGARHNERAWAQRIHLPLLHLFK